MNTSLTYPASGVNYAEIATFTSAMKEVAQRTISFSRRRDMQVIPLAHGGAFRYIGTRLYSCVATAEILGNKSWIAEWMWKNGREEGRALYGNIAKCAAYMAVNDCAAHGALPFMLEDVVSVGDSAWFSSPQALALAEGFFRACQEAHMTLGGGESPALHFLLKPEPPISSAPDIACVATGIVSPPTSLITGEKLCAGDRIVAVASSGLHANGISLLIKIAENKELCPDHFLTKLSNGNTLGAEALIPTRCYADLVEALLGAGVDVHKFLPGTGDGVAKLARHKLPFLYHIDTWLPVPQIFSFVYQKGVELGECLRTFNWGAGYYIFVPPEEVDRTIEIGSRAGYGLKEVGWVESSDRPLVHFGPANITLEAVA